MDSLSAGLQITVTETKSPNVSSGNPAVNERRSGWDADDKEPRRAAGWAGGWASEWAGGRAGRQEGRQGGCEATHDHPRTVPRFLKRVLHSFRKGGN
jgi:hypothetical protein